MNAHNGSAVFSRRVFRFDTLQGLQFFVDRIDADRNLQRNLLMKDFYRLSLMHEGKVPYCVILHRVDLAEEFLQSLLGHASESFGMPEEDRLIVQRLSMYAAMRYLTRENGHSRWDLVDPNASKSKN